jgi:hypothetical protein
MKYLELKPGINILKTEVIGVEAIDEMTCKVLTSIGAYDCIYPSWRILMLLEQPNIEEQLIPTQTPVDRVNLWGNQHFAG